MNETPFAGACWMWVRDIRHCEIDRRVRCRKVFELTAVPETFPALITADAKYTLFVNGQFVHHGPARSMVPVCSFDRIDLAPYLKTGKNLIAILGYQFGVSNYTYKYEDFYGVLFSAPGIKSGEEWKLSEDPGYIRGVAKGSGQYAFQEFYDCSLSDNRWREDADFDDSEWINPYCPVAGVMPWHFFEERGIPLLENHILHPVKIVAASDHPVDPTWREVRSAVISCKNEKSDYRAPETVSDPVSVVYDFGREVVGMLQFSFTADDIVEFMVCETLDDLTPRFCPPNDIYTAYGGRLYPAKGKVCEHELTLPWGFRYLVLYNRSKGKLDCEVSLRECRYALDETGSFNCSDNDLQQIWDICRNAQRCCMADTYMDCPSREYAQWWGDALVQSQNTFRLADDTGLLRRGLRLIGRQKTPEGLTYGVSPGCAHRCILPDYSAMYLVTLHADYMQSASLEMWQEQRETASGIISYFEKYISPSDIVPFDERYWLFVDWCPNLDKIETYNLIILWGIRSAAKLAELSNSEADRQIAARCRALEAKLLAGIKLENPEPHAASLAILLDVQPERHEYLVNEIILPMMKGKHDHPVQPGPYFMYYVFEAVKKAGFAGQIIDCIRRWWGEYCAAGYTATPEHFLGDRFRYTSMCHAWSAHPLKFFSELMLGIRQQKPGWTEVSFEPYVEPGMVVSGTVPTPYGVIEVSLDYSGSELKKSLTLPDGVKLV